MASKMKRFILFFCLFFICDSNEDERQPKFFFGPKLQTVISYKKVPEFVTEFVPSSCIVIEPTLPPCRHVRNLEIYPSVPTRITKTEVPQGQNAPPVDTLNWKPMVYSSNEGQHSPTPPLNEGPQQVKNPSPHWSWNLFNIFRVENFTYTTTKTEYITTRVEDPKTVVSFYIKGCRPSRLPFILPECPRPQNGKPEENIVVVAPLKFVSSDSLIVPTQTENLTEVDEEAGGLEEGLVAGNSTTVEIN